MGVVSINMIVEVDMGNKPVERTGLMNPNKVKQVEMLNRIISHW